MSKQLYEEALADAKKLKEVAEDNAKKSLIEAVTPRIRDLIERELLKEFNEADFDEMDCDDDFGPPGAPMPDGKLMTDIGGVRSPVSSPGPDGKVTLDLDSLARNMGGSPVAAPMFGGSPSTPEEEYMLEPDDALKLGSLSSVLDGGAQYPQTPMAAKYPSEKTFVSDLNKFESKVARLAGNKSTIKESKVFISEINSLVTKLDNMYAYVQESIRDSGRKKLYETRLELYFAKLKTLQEQAMRNRRSLNEMEITFALPEPQDGQDAREYFSSVTDIDAEFDLGDEGEDEDMEGADDDADMEDEEGDDEFDLDSDDEDMEGDDEGEDEDMDLDFGDEDEDEGGDEDEEDLELSSDKPMESRRRSTDNLVVEIDENMLRREIGRMREVRQLREAKALRARRLAEARRRRLYEFETPSADGHGALVDDDFGGDPDMKIEPLKVKLQEYDILEVESDEGNEEDTNKENSSYDPGAKTESRRYGSRNGGNRNGTPSGRAGIAETKLRRQLEETNIFNAKLIYSNKLLQNESLSRRQKAEIIERLDEAKTLREVKLVYESLTRAMAGTSRPLRENTTRKVLGSSSMTTRPASTQLNEGIETERWARLAGITK